MLIDAKQVEATRARPLDWDLICAMFHRQSPPCAG
jgi:hypothetical protein